MTDKFDLQLKALGIELSGEKKLQFLRYYEMLAGWNKLMNLTSVTGRDEVYDKHFIDSLSLVKAINVDNCESLIDIGAGAGFPGVPVKIAFPHLKTVLIDSLAKRIRFLNAVAEELGLRDISAVHARAEDNARRPLYRERFDICVSRAVASLPTLCEYCLPYVKIGGFFVAYKSENIGEELSASLNAIKILGGEIKDTVKFKLPGTDIGRILIKIEKVRATDKKYPRKAGIPSKKPVM